MKNVIVKLLKKHYPNLEIENLLEVPPNPTLGDFSFPCFSLAKIEKKSPLLIAQSLVEKLRKELPKEITNVSATAGYVNFFTNKTLLSSSVLDKILKEKRNYGKLKQKQKFVMDYSHPNVAKHFGVHNLRSTLIGHAIYNILGHAGNEVISVNHLGDWGTQFGKLIVAFKKWGTQSKLKDIEYLNSLYVKFHEETSKNKELEEELEQEARDEFKKLEDGDKINLALWKKFLDLSMKEFNDTYKILGIKFDQIKGESFYREKIADVVEKIKSKGLLEKSEGAQVVKLGENMPPCIIEKSDEASTYASRDLAAILERLKENPNKILYVVDIRQSLHFEQVFLVAEKLGIPKEKLVHVKFGLMKFKDMEMSTRKGKVILFEALLEKATEEILKIINEKNPKLKNKNKIAQNVALAAIIFADLQNNRIHDVVFDWEKALSFDGKSGPYILYTYARASSVISKAKKKTTKTKEVDQKEQEIELIKHLGLFPEKIEQSANNFSPHVLADYTYELAQSFNEFYHSCPILGTPEQAFRLKLVEAFKIVMKSSLNLLGIETVDEM